MKKNLPELKSIFKEIMKEPEKMFDYFRLDLKEACENAVSRLIELELTSSLEREKYERTRRESVNHRNGYYERQYTVKNFGNLKIKVARDRKGIFQSKLIAKYDRYEKAIEKDLAIMFLSGMSTRNISLVSKTLIGRSISATEVSKANQELLSGIDRWRLRQLNDLRIKYMMIDGVFFDMRQNKEVSKVPMLVVLGVTDDNKKVFLTIQQGDKDSASTWREVFKDLKSRGINKDSIQLGVMDGLPGLEKVFTEEFPSAKIQRCQVHVSRNVLCKVPQKQKEKVADQLRDIFYASGKDKAMEYFDRFVKEHENLLPSAVKCLKNSINRCLTFYSFPKEEWISLRTTNLIERVNKEFKRRTKPMEILAGEASAYRLLSFIALKMELNWRKAPLGRNNLPCLDKFTQNT